tara:strand:+ start:3722 stop:4639 length:918 start_codon:yes stop_codon:yes gene_type:complete
MEKKTININPDLFDISTKKKKEKKDLSLKLNSKSIKKDLINKIKSHQKTKKNFKKNNNQSIDFSMNNLKNIINDIKENNTQNINEPQIFTSLPKSLISHDSNDYSTSLPYGNLKNGTKPTYRNWMKKTQKNQSIIDNHNQKYDDALDQHIIDVNTINNHDNIIHDLNLIHDNDINNQIVEENINKNNDIQTHNPNKTLHKKYKKKRIKQKTTRKKYTCGMNKTKKSISIIIKDPSTKDKINNEKYELSKLPISTIKKFLYDRSFIKIGTNAPDDILRAMYESCILSGNVKNDNSEMIIHNYMNTY